jgi:hypothetical protein
VRFNCNEIPIEYYSCTMQLTTILSKDIFCKKVINVKDNIRKYSFHIWQITKMWRYLFLCPILFILSLGCIIWGSITASFYAKNRNIIQSHRISNCLLLDYRVTEHLCQSCDGDASCTIYQCFDEILWLSYTISNGSRTIGISHRFNQEEMHRQRKVCIV